MSIKDAKFEVVAKVNSLREIKDFKDLRRRVFVDEQGVEIEEENDHFDPKAIHVGLRLDGVLIGNIRLIKISEDRFKLGRMAILKEYRGCGLGKLMMAKACEIAISEGISEIELSSQEHTSGFYEKLGFKKVGEVYLEEKQPHVLMVRKLNSAFEVRSSSKDKKSEN